jgi:hypothetical protein
MRVLALLLSGVLIAAARSQTPDTSVKAVAAAAATYLAEYQRQFSYLLADEDYTQQVVASTSVGADQRRMIGESFLTYLPGDRAWIAIHDIAQVDGQPVAGREDLRLLLQREPVAGVARLLAQRNARFNIGRISRNFNEPTLGLLVLDARRQRQFKFDRRAVERDGTATIVTLKFKETEPPTIVHGTDGSQVFSTGEVAIDAETGCVRSTTIQFKYGAITASLTTQFVRDPKLEMWVPSLFSERYESTDKLRELVLGEATYSNYRRFDVQVRIR